MVTRGLVSRSSFVTGSGLFRCHGLGVSGVDWAWVGLVLGLG